MKATTRAVLPAYLIAAVALFVALGGPAEAKTLITGAQIKDGTVTGVDIKDRSLTGADVKDGSLGSADVADNSLTTSDLKDGSVTGADVKDGSLGVADLSAAAQSGLTTSACGAGQTLMWTGLPVERVSDGTTLFDSATYRVGRCFYPGASVIGDGKLQVGEQCDDGNAVSGDGCNSSAQWEFPVRLSTALN